MGQKMKKFAKGVGAFIWTIHVGPLGFVADIVENVTKIDEGNLVSDLAYAGKSAAYNSVRKIWGKEPKVFDEAKGTTSEQIIKKHEENVAKYCKDHGVDEEKAEEIIRGVREGAPGGKKSKVPRVSYQEGASDNPTAFVFSCPGQKEMRFGSVCAGETGVNLSMVIDYCSKVRPDVFPYSDKGSYLITNASDIVHFKKLTGDTEAGDEEILARENLQRLRDELRSKHTIICMGDRARTAVREAGIGGRAVYFDHHLSNQKLNRAYTNDMLGEDLTPAERREKRIELVAKELLRIV